MLIYYIETMPDEAATAAWISVVCPNVRTISMVMSQTSEEFEEDAPASTGEEIIFIGSYWDHRFAGPNPPYRNSRITIYSKLPFRPESMADAVEYVCLIKGQNLCTILLSRCVRSVKVGYINFASDTLSRYAGLITDRMWGDDLETTQHFFSGVARLPGSTSFERFKYAMGQGLQPTDIIAGAQALVNFQKELIATRVRDTSALITLKSGLWEGMTGAVINSPELINLSHEVLAKTYPTADLTIVESIKYPPGRTGPIRVISVRSVSDQAKLLNLGEVFGKMTSGQGGGSGIAAGFSTLMDQGLDWWSYKL